MSHAARSLRFLDRDSAAVYTPASTASPTGVLPTSQRVVRGNVRIAATSSRPAL